MVFPSLSALSSDKIWSTIASLYLSSLSTMKNRYHRYIIIIHYRHDHSLSSTRGLGLVSFLDRKDEMRYKSSLLLEILDEVLSACLGQAHSSLGLEAHLLVALVDAVL